MVLPIITSFPAPSVCANHTTIHQALHIPRPNRISPASDNMQFSDTPAIAIGLTTPPTSPTNTTALTNPTTYYVSSSTPHGNSSIPHRNSTTPRSNSTAPPTNSPIPPTTPEHASLPSPRTPPKQIITPNTTTPPPAPKKPCRGIIPFRAGEIAFRYNNNSIPLSDLSNRLHRAREEADRLKRGRAERLELLEKPAAKPVVKQVDTAAKEIAEQGYVADTEGAGVNKNGRGGKGKGPEKTSSQNPAAGKAPIIGEARVATKAHTHDKDPVKKKTVVVWAVRLAKGVEKFGRPKAVEREQPGKKEDVTKSYRRCRARGGARCGGSIPIKEEEAEYDGDAE